MISSKLALLMHTYDFSERLRGTGVTVNAIHPGMARSNFSKNVKGILGVIGKILYLIYGISLEKAARMSIRLAMDPTMDSVTGRYFLKEKERKSSARSYHPASRQRLREYTDEFLIVS